MPVGMDIPGATAAASNEWEAEQLADPLLEAAEEGDAAAVARLLRQGADVDAREEPNHASRYSIGWTAGKTPLIKASQQGHIECVRVLLAAEADLGAKDDDCWTALHWAANNGHASVAKLLLDAGAKAAAKDHEKRTPLTYAAIRGHPEVVKLLLDCGGHAAGVDRFGKSALSLAIEHGHSAAARLLQEHAERSKHGQGSPPSDPDVARCAELERELVAAKGGLGAAA
ncbi:MAG: ankyrin repeat-containing domain protein [Monoraphidium minutum]|nr:MAG: ankyrin repeat-containing domain protein [Monoraphidium minutum]